MPPLFPAPTKNADATSSVKLDVHHEHVNEQKDKLADRLAGLSKSELIQHAIDTHYTLHEWRHAASDLLSVLALSPEMTDAFYARSLRVMLKTALESLDSVDCLQHLECSMPSVAVERPIINVTRWDGLHYSEWSMQWSPKSWWVSVSADGSRWGLAFNCLANISAISLRGHIQCSFSPDLTALRIRFVEKPSLNMLVETTVGFGIVPLPVQESIQEIIRDRIKEFVDIRLCNDQGMVIVLRRKPLHSISDNDIYEATMQAKRAKNIRLKSSSFF